MPVEDVRLADRPPIEDVLLQAVTGNTTGVWKPTSRKRPIHVTVEGVGGAFSATVTIYATLQRIAPADSDLSRIVLGTTTGQPMSLASDVPYAWVKAEVTGYASGTIFAGLAAG